MEVISLIGIIAGIAFFILCCCKGIQMFLAALLASVIIIVFSLIFMKYTAGKERNF